MPRVTFEIDSDEQDALLKLLESLRPKGGARVTSASLFRALLKLAVTGKADLTDALNERPILKVGALVPTAEKPKVRKGWDAPKGSRY